MNRKLVIIKEIGIEIEIASYSQCTGVILVASKLFYLYPFLRST